MQQGLNSDWNQPNNSAINLCWFIFPARLISGFYSGEENGLFDSLSSLHACLSTLRRWWGGGGFGIELKKKNPSYLTPALCHVAACSAAGRKPGSKKRIGTLIGGTLTDPPWLRHVINALSASTHTQVNMKLTQPGLLKFGCSLRENLLINSHRNQSPSEITYFEAVILPAMDVLIF